MQHQTALIAGAGGGVGSAIARTLAEAGVRLALVGRDRQKLERCRDSLGAAGSSAVIETCDVTDRGGVKTMVETVLGTLASIDILICSAGINVTQRSLRSLDPADWDRVLATNLTGSYNLIHFALPAMRSRGNGLIVQMSSVSGLRANTVSGVAYSASKFAQGALGICIGREERGRGIRSTVLCAGEVNTPFLAARADRPGGGGGESRLQVILQPEDIAAAVRFLAELPPRVHIPELVIKPTIDDFS